MKYYIEEKTEDGGSWKWYNKQDFYIKLKEFCFKHGLDYEWVLMKLLCFKHYKLEVTDYQNSRNNIVANLFIIEDTICEIADIIESYNDSLLYSNNLNCAISIYNRLKLGDRKLK